MKPITPPYSQTDAHMLRQLGALLCDDIECLADIARDPTLTAEDLRRQIALLKEDKDVYLNDSAERESRYAAACALYSLGGAKEST